MNIARKKGFTLLEVLVALVIIAIAFVSVFAAVSSHIQKLIYLENKIAAEWVALNVIEEIKLGVITQQNAEITGTKTMLNKNYAWKAKTYPTDNKSMARLEVDVHLKNERGNLIHRIAFLGTNT